MCRRSSKAQGKWNCCLMAVSCFIKPVPSADCGCGVWIVPVDSKQWERAYMLSSVFMGEDEQTTQTVLGAAWFINSLATSRLHFWRQFINSSVSSQWDHWGIGKAVGGKGGSGREITGKNNNKKQTKPTNRNTHNKNNTKTNKKTSHKQQPKNPSFFFFFLLHTKMQVPLVQKGKKQVTYGVSDFYESLSSS